MKTVALVGRPNVGKSRLFNRLIGRRYSIVEGTPGITRDRVEFTVDWGGTMVRMIDTGGIGSADPLKDEIRLQALIAVAAADIVLLVVDIRDGLLPLDKEIATWLRGAGAERDRVIVVANKADDANSSRSWTEFAKLGFQPIIALSAEHGRNYSELSELLRSRLVGVADEEEEPTAIRLAIVGRPNVGKSSLLNSLLGENRAIVSPKPGTTRDTLKETIKFEDGIIELVDTAGIRKRRRDFDLLESIMVRRTGDAVRECDVAIVMIDAIEGITDQDLRILNAVFSEGKGAVIGLNKWDAVAKKDFDPIAKEIQHRMGSEAHVPIVSISALKKLRLQRLLKVAMEVGENLRRQIPTARFNEILAAAARRSPRGGRIKYGIQKSMIPPTFVLFGAVKPPKSFQSYVRNEIRAAGKFAGVPIMVEFRK